MSWVAKNDITGVVYGKPFESIYDCQKFIDTELLKLQFLYSMIVGLENDIKKESCFNEWFESKYGKDCHNYVALEFSARIEYAIKDLFDGLPRNPRNNVIRCFNVQQKRFADGFDF